MLNKKDILLLGQLFRKFPNFITEKEQTIFPCYHYSRLWKCLKKLETYGLITIREVDGNPHFKLTNLKGFMVTPILIGFGVLSGDKDFERHKENALV